MRAERKSHDWTEDASSRTKTDTRELDPKLRVLRQVSLFQDLDDDASRALAAGATLRSYAKGATIMRKDDASRTLLVVATGRVEAVLEPLGASPVRVCEFVPGEYFGEMALEASEILEIDSEAVLAQLTTPMTRKLLQDLATRVRRTDATVTELADKVYRAAYANVHAAVRVELDTIKTLYHRTDELSHRALEQAEKRGEATVSDASRIVSAVQQRIDSTMALLTKRIAPIGSALALILGALGIHSYLDVQAKYKEAVGWHDSLGKFQERVRSADKSLRVISETMTDLRSAREAASLHAPIQTSAELRRAALDFERAKAQLYERYIASPHEGTRYEQFDPDVVFEATTTFVELASWGRTDGKPAVSHNERAQLLAALSFVVRTLGDIAEAASGGAQSLLDRKLRDVYYQLAVPTEGVDRRQLLAALGHVLERPASARARDNAALILASLSEKTQAVRDVLATMMNDGRPWHAASGAIALAKLRDGAGWKRIKRGLDDPSMRYAFAALLAQEGVSPLRTLAKSFNDGARLDAITRSMNIAIAGHVPRNCYEQRYDRWLAQCLAGPCEVKDGPIGGDCTLSGG
jgi:CRP-like cAMP-binding protein